MNQAQQIQKSLGEAAKPRVFYRAINPGDTRRITTGDRFWDSLLFLSSERDKVSVYGTSVDKWVAKSGAKILYEGTRDFQKMAKGVERGLNMLKWASDISRKAKAEGWDAVWFKRQIDIGTAVLNPKKFSNEGEVNLTEANTQSTPGRMYPRHLWEAMRSRPPALEPWKNRKHVRIRQQANDMVAAGTLKPKACQHRGCSVGPSKTVKHHVAYDRPDNVKWYCEPHHDDTHAAMDKMPVESCSGNCPTCNRESCRCSYNVAANQSQKIIQSLQEGTP